MLRHSLTSFAISSLLLSTACGPTMAQVETAQMTRGCGHEIDQFVATYCDPLALRRATTQGKPTGAAARGQQIRTTCAHYPENASKVHELDECVAHAEAASRPREADGASGAAPAETGKGRSVR